MKRSFKKQTLSMLLSCALVACSGGSSAHHFLQVNKISPPSIAQRLISKQTMAHHLDQPLVTSNIQRYCKHAYQIEQTLQQSLPFLSTVMAATQNANLPGELALIPYIESHYNPDAHSRTGAVGLWQMMPGTASGFGLRINWWTDERKDALKSTEAALAYLSYLHDYFNHNWLLAIAAYDAGEGTIKKAIQYNKKRHRPVDFWSLKLPRETKQYIPKLLALAEVIQTPQSCHLTLPTVPITPLIATPINHQMDFDTIAGLAQAPLAMIHEFNPHYLRGMTENNHPEQTILLPKSYADNLIQVTKNYDHAGTVLWQHHRVMAGETLASIAKHHQSTPMIIKTINRLHADAIDTGQHLLIHSGAISEHAKAQAALMLNQHHSHHQGPQQHLHTIAPKETLKSIAKLYQLTPGKIRYWNPKDSRLPLIPGGNLVLWLPRINHFDDYIVQPGDNLSAIALQFSTSIAAIRTANNLHHHTIYPDQRLKIPLSHPANAHKIAIIYTVKPGDSLYTIAKAHHLPLKDIIDWNQVNAKRPIKPGQPLTLYR